MGRIAKLTMMALIAGGSLAMGVQIAGANAVGPNRLSARVGLSVDRPPVCTDYTLFYDLTGTGNDYLSTSLTVCSNQTFTTGQASGGTWAKAHKVYTFNFAPQDAVYRGRKTPTGFNTKRKPGKILLPAGGIWYAT